MLLKRDDSALLLIDMQEKLTPRVHQSDMLIKQCSRLLHLAASLNVPKCVTEQYPEGLGYTVAPLRAFFKEEKPIEKLTFSCLRESSFKEKSQILAKKQIVLIGIETHVCVLQTAFDLIAMGFETFVVVDAVSSRNPLDYHYGLKRMKQRGAELVTAEMVFFEWIGQSGTAEFKALSKTFFA